jgi:glycosyltransferase involved in cell wall biosynthesis
VLTVHDVLFASNPALFDRRLGVRLRLTVGRAVRRAARILVPTATTRAALLTAYPFVDPRRVRLVPLGIDMEVFQPEPRAEVELHAGGPYVLSVGRPHPRKNLGILMAALAVARPELRLVLAGPHRDAEAGLLALARDAGLGTERVTVVADVSDADLAALYRSCSVFCYPSLGEGFGLPALEALACGAPTVISRDPALREVCGDAATAVDARDPQALARAIDAAVNDDARARARQEGPARAAGFTLEAMASKTLEVYEELL